MAHPLSDLREPEPHGRRQQLIAAAACGAVLLGLMIAAAAAGAPTPGGDVGAPRPPLVVLALAMDTLLGVFAVLGIAMVVLVVWALATAPRPGEPRRRPWWHQLVGVALLGVVASLTAWVIGTGWMGDRLPHDPQAGIGPGAADAPWPDGAPPGAQLDPAHRQAATVAGALLAALGVGAAAWWLTRRRDVEPVPVEDAEPSVLRHAVEAALDDMAADVDPRTAILRCFRHLDVALEEAGLPRRSSETAREHRQRAALLLGDAAPAASRLVALFERARYDDAPLPEDARTEAEQALEEAHAVLAPQAKRRPRATTGRRP